MIKSVLFTFIVGMAASMISLYGQALLPEFSWADNGGNGSFSEGNVNISSTGDGYIYMSGDFEGNAKFGPVTFNSNGGKDVFFAKMSEAGEMLWVKTFGGTEDEFVTGIETDDESNIIISGAFYGTTNIGTETFVSAGSQDLFIAKFNSDGDFIWANNLSSGMTAYLKAMDVDSNGNIFITGKFYDALMAGTSAIYSRGGSDFYIAMYDPDGNLQWLEQGGSTGTDDAISIASGNGGDLYVTGSFYEQTQLGDSLFFTSHPTGVFLAKYNTNSGFEWAGIIDGTNLSAESRVTVSADNGIYMAGNFSEEVTFGSQTFVAGEFNLDIYITRYTTDGNLEWARHGGSNASDDVVAIATDQNNNLYLAGHYLLDINFGNVNLTYTLCCGSSEIYIVKFDNKGTAEWGKQVSGVRARINDIEHLSSGKLGFAGLFQQEVALDSLNLEATTENNDYFGVLEMENITHVDQIAYYNSVLIYPNPASGEVFLKPETATSGLTAVFYDNTGRLVKEVFLPGPSDIKIDISGLAPGLYQLVITDNSGKIVSQAKLMVGY